MFGGPKLSGQIPKPPKFFVEHFVRALRFLDENLPRASIAPKMLGKTVLYGLVLGMLAGCRPWTNHVGSTHHAVSALLCMGQSVRSGCLVGH
eukprot:scaffold7001_cov93-Skeletonema_dohrnii-CCMP3373.AAC.1